MSCLGVHFALTGDKTARLLNAEGDRDVRRIVQEEIEASWDRDWLQETGKSWDAIHRCLTDGTLRCKGQSIREKCILGGKQLHRRNNYIVSFIGPNEVEEVAEAIQVVTREWFRERYFKLKKKFLWFEYSDYDGTVGEEDFECAWGDFELLRSFFARAAAAARPVIFTVDQVKDRAVNGDDTDSARSSVNHSKRQRWVVEHLSGGRFDCMRNRRTRDCRTALGPGEIPGFKSR